MELPIPNNVTRLWDAWQLRACIIFSLFLQAFLTCFAPCRQRCQSRFLIFFLWSAYLLADWVAAVAIGLITQSQTDLCESNGSSGDDLFAFWASLLLLHLGGPDSITSFALEDNEFWLRHLFGLVLQVVGAAYSVYLTLPNNKLWLPTLLVFVVGVIKYGERTRALYLASSNRFGATILPKPDPGPDYEEVAAGTYVEIPAQGTDNLDVHDLDFFMDLVPDSVVDENKLLQLAYPFYESFKGIFVGLSPSVECRVSTRNTLMKLHDTVIFVVIGYELGFLYEALHTKVAVIRRKFSFVVRFICSSFIVVSSALLFFSVKKQQGSSNKFDIGLTYALLISAMVLDYVSFIQLISSDWPVAALKGINCLRKIFPAVTCHPRQRWSESMSQYDLISYCLKDDERPLWLYKLADFLHAREILNKIQILLFSSSVNVTLEKVTLILDWLREKFPTELPVNSEARSIRRRRYSTGVFTSEYLRAYKKKELSFRIYREPLLSFESRETEWAELFLRTHLVIEMFFFLTFKKGDERLLKAIMNLKHLSNYAFSLILTQPGMISSMLGDAWNEIFRDTCDELKRFFLENKIADHYEACKKLLQKYCSYSEHPSALAVTRSGSKSVLADACEEAVSLFDDVGAEESLRDFVILFLLRASRSCTPMLHAEQLSKGGEFLTFIWLLQTHFGIIPGAQDIVAGVRRRD